jgi:hypothetical protein
MATEKKLTVHFPEAVAAALDGNDFDLFEAEAMSAASYHSEGVSVGGDSPPQWAEMNRTHKLFYLLEQLSREKDDAMADADAQRDGFRKTLSEMEEDKAKLAAALRKQQLMTQYLADLFIMAIGGTPPIR